MNPRHVLPCEDWERLEPAYLTPSPLLAAAGRAGGGPQSEGGGHPQAAASRVAGRAAAAEAAAAKRQSGLGQSILAHIDASLAAESACQHQAAATLEQQGNEPPPDLLLPPGGGGGSLALASGAEGVQMSFGLPQVAWPRISDPMRQPDWPPQAHLAPRVVPLSSNRVRTAAPRLAAASRDADARDPRGAGRSEVMTGNAPLAADDIPRQPDAAHNARGRAAVQPLAAASATAAAPRSLGPASLAASSVEPHSAVQETLRRWGAVDEVPDLVRSAEKGDSAAVRSRLEQGENPNSHDGFGMTALHGAAKKGYGEVVTLLLNWRADVNWRADAWRGETPLHYAAKYARAGVALQLLEGGADARVASHDGRTALEYARERGHTQLEDMLERSLR